MMTKPHRQLGPCWKKLVLAPLFTDSFLSMRKSSSPRKENKLKSIRQLRLLNKIFWKHHFTTKDENGNIISEKNSQLSSEEQKNIPPPPPATAQKQTGKEQTAKALENAVGPKYVELIVNNKIMTRSITLQGLNNLNSLVE
jgi:hypothetical protein